MKKFLSILMASVFLLTSLSNLLVFAEDNDSYEISIVYEFNQPAISEINLNGIVYDRVVIQGSPSAGDPGEPLLPMHGGYVLVPMNTKVSDIYVKSIESELLGDNFNVLPTSNPIPISMMDEIPIPIPKMEIYSFNNQFPDRLFNEVDTYNYRGYSILVLELHPIQYLPIDGALIYHSKLEITLTLQENYRSYPLIRGKEDDKLNLINKIDNPSIINTYDVKSQHISNSNDQYDLLILTTEDFKNEFEILKNTHEAKGMSTEIKTLKDISLITGDVTPEDIRNFVREEYVNNGIEYVLIGGDSDIIPVKMLWVFGLDEDTWPYETKMPSDLYYACLDGTYNYDDDSKWGEPTDGDNGGDVDLLADVYVGRACVGNLDEVQNFVDKTISYLNINPNDNYLNEICQAGEYLGDYGIASWGGNYLDLLIDESDIDGYATTGIPSNDFSINKLYDRDWENNNWPQEEIISIVNDGVHIINHDGHSNYQYNMKMYSSDVNQFTNDKFCFVYSIGCMAGGFDDPNGYDCFAEYLTVKTEHGAFAAIMNARYGWFWAYSTDGDSTRYTREFWDAVFGEKIPVISKANQDSKEDNLFLIERSCMRWTYYQLNLFGDPTIAFYISNPPEKPLTPIGQNLGKIDEEYTFSTSSSDPDGDQLFYLFDWDDGTDIVWQGPYNSGESVEFSHIWNKMGRYAIKVKAKDINGVESPWSDPVSFIMSKNKLNINQNFINFLENHHILSKIICFIYDFNRGNYN